MDQVQPLLDQCDKFCEQMLGQQIKQLVSYFHLQLIRQFSHPELASEDVDDKKQGEEVLISRETQQLFIEYTCLPLLSLEEDVEPSSEFSVRFIELLQSNYIDFAESQPMYDLIHRVVLPICTSSTVDINSDDDQIKQLGQLRVFINCYFASLVPTCQRYVLRELGEVLSLFSVPVRLWTLKAFYVPVLKGSFDVEKRKLAQNVLAKYKSDWSKDLNWVSFLKPVEFLSDKQPVPNMTKSRVDQASVAINLCFNLIDVSRTGIMNLCKSLESAEIKPVISKSTYILSECYKLLKYGDLETGLNNLKQHNESEKRKKRRMNSQHMINGIDSLMTSEECQQLLESIMTLSPSVMALVNYSLVSHEVETILLVNKLVLILCRISNLVVSRVQINSVIVITYYQFMESFVVDLIRSQAKVTESVITKLQITSSKHSNRLSNIQSKIINILFIMLLRSRSISNLKITHKSILATLVSSVTTVTPPIYIIRLSNVNFEQIFVSILDATLIRISNTLLKLNNPDHQMNFELIQKYLTTILRAYIIQYLELCKILSLNNADDKLDLVFNKLLNTLTILEYEQLFARRKSNIQQRTSSSLNLLLRLGIARLLQTTSGLYHQLTPESRQKLKIG